MSSRFAVALIAAALVGGLGAGTPTAPPPPSSSATPTAASAPAQSYSLQLPPRWTGRKEDGVETITGPEGLVTLKVIETSQTDLAKAIREAWAMASPEMKLPERSRWHGAAGDRFQKSMLVTYTDDKDEYVGQANALAHKDGKRVYVLLTEGPIKEVRKREAEISRIVGSLEVAGAKEVELVAADAKPFDAKKAEALFAFVEKLRKADEIPGVAVAVVSKGDVFAQGFGTRAKGSTKPVDADTLFMMGSITKSFSTLLLATLVDDGKFTWETPVQAVYPGFKVADPVQSKKIQMQHLFCACIGAPRQDAELVFQFADVTPADTMRNVARMKLTTEPGETFQYNNQLTAAGGFIAGHLADPKEKDLGKAYSKALRARVLDKIGMRRSELDIEVVEKDGNFAMPHGLEWQERSVPRDLSLEQFVRPVAPAGALWSTVNDMAKYIQVQLARGKGVVSEENLQRTQTEQVKVGEDLGYGMGWLVGKYRGLVAIQHSGGTSGFSSNLVFFPELDLGLFVVANRNATVGLSWLTQRRLFELMFDQLEPRAESRLTHDLGEFDKQLAKQAAWASSEPIPKEVLGRYRSERLGDMRIVPQAGGGVLIDVGEWRAVLRVFDPKERPNTLLISSGPLQGITLLREERDGKPVLVLKDSQTDYVFEKR